MKMFAPAFILDVFCIVICVNANAVPNINTGMRSAIICHLVFMIVPFSGRSYLGSTYQNMHCDIQLFLGE